MTKAVGLALIILAVDLATAGPSSAQIPSGTPSDLFRDDVHAQAGLTCDSCHGKAASGEYRSIARTEIALLCSRCHSDAAYMRRFRPQLRVDQYAQYLTSTHGKGHTSHKQTGIGNAIVGMEGSKYSGFLQHRTV